MSPRGQAARRPVRGVSRLTFATAFISVALSVSCDRAMPTETTLTLPVIAADHVGSIPGNGRPFSLEMSQEVTATFSGDPDGAGTAELTVNPGQRSLCWSLNVRDIALPATASHVHRAPSGLAGPVVVGLSAPGASGTSSGCANGVDRDLLIDIITNPESYYVNVHTTDYSRGAIRSQMQ